ncbi:MAG: antitoxin [Comamonadaceae bacterium]|nr:antitoxin [Comamonadaceae bacterium]
MQLAQKISVSLDATVLGFIDRYAAEHAAKGRSAVVVKALQLLQRSEQESQLSEAYAQSAEQDRQMAADFDITLSDGLKPATPNLKATNATW